MNNFVQRRRCDNQDVALAFGSISEFLVVSCCFAVGKCHMLRSVFFKELVGDSLLGCLERFASD